MIRLQVNIDVPEIEAAARFYEAALGLRVERILDGDVAELAGAGSMVYLLKKDAETAANSRATAKRDYGHHWTPVHVDFVVHDVQAAVARARAAGARQESDFVEWLGSTCVTFSDPFGNGFCLIQFSGDTYRDGEPGL